ncbi:MAG: hypothetical protein GYA58_04790 [Anaerolineaceae bacterium]|nr:hypothetical protein [Anaerolineaceae bacterium]
MNELAIAVVAVRCSSCGQTFGISYKQVIQGEWIAYWAFPLTDAMSRREGYADTRLQGVCKFDSTYPGCPYCHNTGLVQCGRCHHVNCWDGRTPEFHCFWCGNSGAIIENGDFHDLQGAGDL